MAVRQIFQAIIPDSSERTPDTNKAPPLNIERIAINQRGFIGSLYDGYEDNIKGKLTTNIKLQSYESKENVKCVLIEGRTNQSQNLLKFIDIDGQLRLSIVLKMVPATGIASLIDYPRLIDRHTRLLYFYQESRIESCRDKLHKLRETVTKSTSEKYATHIITEIIWGIHLLVILQLPPDQEEDIHALLSKLHQSLSKNGPAVKMYSNERILLDHIISTTVYSNISNLTKINRLDDIYERIIELQKNDKEHRPLKYILTPIHWFYGQHGAVIPTLRSSEPNEIETLENYLLQQSSELKVLDLRLNRDLPELLQRKFTKQLKNIQDELSQLHVLQIKEAERIYKIVLDIRTGKKHSNDNNELSLDPPTEIQHLIRNINIHIKELESKVNFIKLLKNDEFEYCDVSKLGIEQRLKEEVVKDMLFGNDSHKAIFFSSDELRNNDELTFTERYSEMIEELKNNPQLRLVYADFTYSTYTLKKMVITLSSNTVSNNDHPNPQSSESDTKRKTPSPPPSSANEYINILLLGESGVGKSTFINAFVNYLYFESLGEAQKGESVVIIPVSFVMTINDQFDERLIKFGEDDPNENHNNFGQSVTQQCKSYVFNISDEKKLRIIDTPGFGDTRGSDQDNLNMEEIFSFVNNFTYLNGICLLFKPEVTQLNPYFQSCCTQLFDYFGKNIRDYFIFCFTNARSTFFTPGNTRPLLQTFFNSFSVKNIPFEKRNTFCFDSESFRYLIAIQNEITFDRDERNEFEQSWLRSVDESKRFRDFLCNQHSYRKNDEWQSTADAEFQINFMIRPMLEAMRNLLRNLLLYDLNSSIKLYATNTESSSILCYTCNRNPEKFGQFWILPDHLHNSLNMCTSNEQKSTEYRLDYEVVNYQMNESIDALKGYVDCLCEACARLALFPMKMSKIKQDDPFLSGINRMINEEKFICQRETSSSLNQKLVDKLEQLKTQHERQLNVIESNGKTTNLSNIYELIKLVNGTPMIKVQLDAIRKYQQLLLESNEHAVDKNKTCFS